MTFSRLKELVGKLGGLLILDGDEPAFVVLSYDKYQKMEAGEEIPVSSRNGFNGLDETFANGIDSVDETTVEKLNQEILVLKEEIRQKEEAELVGNEQSTEPVAGTVDFD